MSIKSILVMLSLVLTFLTPIETKAVSSSVKATDDYYYTMNVIRKLNNIVSNYPSEINKTNFEKIKDLFNQAGINYYGLSYSDAVIKFMNLKKELIIFTEIVAKNYLERTKLILDSTTKETFDIIIDFNKYSSFAQYFNRPFNPLEDIKPYNDQYSSKDFHFFYDREKIEAYLQQGYKSYQLALRKFNNPDIDLLKKKKKMTSVDMNSVINNYMNIIDMCREGKQYGIEIYKIRNINDLGEIQKKHNILGKKMRTIFDDRIPNDYKVDAIDNENLIYSIEIKHLNKK